MRIHERSNRGWFSFALFLAVGMFGYLLPVVGYFTSVPGDLADARLNNTILEHIYRWMGGQDHSLWSPPFFYPFERTLAFGDNHFGSAAPYVISRWLGFSRERAHDSWFLVGGLLNYFVAFFVLRRMGFSGLASSGGAFIFAFSLPTHLHQEAHSQLLYRYAVPLAIFGVYRALESERFFYFWHVFLWTAVQFYCSIYLGVFLVYLLVATILAILFSRFGWRKVARMAESITREPILNHIILMMVALFSVLAVGWLLRHYQTVAHEYDLSRPLSEISHMLPRPGSYLISDSSRLSSWVGRWITDIPFRWEHQMFVGMGVLMIAMCGAWATLRSAQNSVIGMIALISLGLLLIGTLHIDGHSFYLWLTKVPGLSSIRAVSRIILVMLFPVAILGAVGIEWLGGFRAFRSGGMALALTAGLAVLLSAETIFAKHYNEPISAWESRLADLKELLPSRLPNQPILYVSQRLAEPYYLVEMDAMILAQYLGIPTLNGASGNYPPYYVKPEPCVAPVNRLYAYADFRRMPRANVENQVSRIVSLSPEPCEGERIVMADQAVSSAQAKLIRIQIDNINRSKRRFMVTIRNDSPEIFTSVSSKRPILLSWRFVPLDAKGVAMANPEWGTRKEWLFAIRPGGAVSTIIATDFPGLPGRYRIEVSMVQEGMAWLHDLGMPIGMEIENET